MPASTLPSPTPAQQHARERLTIAQRLMIACSLLGFVLMMYPGWWLLAALAVQLTGIGLAIWVLTLLPRAKASAAEYTVVILFLLGLLYLAFGTTVQLIFMDQTNAFAECMNSAVTISRQNKCTQQLQDGLLGTLLGGSN